MESKEKALIGEFNTRLQNDAGLHVILTDDKRSQAFLDFSKELSHLAPRIRIQSERNDALLWPALQIERNIRYHAIPLAKELEPFLDAVSTIHHTDTAPKEASDLKRIRIPADLKLYIALQCMFCPEAVRKLVSLAAKSPLIHLSIIDASLFPELARNDAVRSVPTAVLDGHFRWTGIIPLEDIIDTMIHRDPVNVSTTSIESMLIEGEAERVSQMIIDHGILFPALIALLTSHAWHVRLGAMVVMETIWERDKPLAKQAIDPLWKRIKEVDESVQGDIIYVLGIIGNDRVKEKLSSLLDSTPDSELRNAITDAIQCIEEIMARG